MARKKNTNIGKYLARYEYTVSDEGDSDCIPEVHDTPEEAMSNYLVMGGVDAGDVVYVYKVVAVKKIVRPAALRSSRMP